MKKLITRYTAIALVLAFGISLTPAGFNNMVINTVAKKSSSQTVKK